MCEYCGCQEVTAIDELTREHDLVVTLIGRGRAAAATADVPTLAALAVEIAAVLGPHTAVEEHGLFPALAGEFPQKVAVLYDEHRRIEAVLAEAADGAPADPAWPDRLADALRLLREHILKEQDGVFPAALSTLGPDEWDAVDRVRAEVGSRLERPGAGVKERL